MSGFPHFTSTICTIQHGDVIIRQLHSTPHVLSSMLVSRQALQFKTTTSVWDVQHRMITGQKLTWKFKLTLQSIDGTNQFSGIMQNSNKRSTTLLSEHCQSWCHQHLTAFGRTHNQYCCCQNEQCKNKRYLKHQNNTSVYDYFTQQSSKLGQEIALQMHSAISLTYSFGFQHWQTLSEAAALTHQRNFRIQ